ncbi:MAG: hypothetical protein ICV54_10955 [Nostoc sp. C3-bin3]|nr:hypothetical protein [Nostoc sp. C3-bin3]
MDWQQRCLTTAALPNDGGVAASPASDRCNLWRGEIGHWALVECGYALLIFFGIT